MPGVVRARHPPPPLLPSIGPSWGRRQHVPENSSSPSSVISHDYRLSVPQPQVSTKMSNGESSRACHCSKMAHILDTDNTRLSADVCTCSPEDHLRVCRQPQIPERHLPQTPAVKPSTATDLQAVGASEIENQCCCRRRRENGSVYIGNSFSAMNMEEEETCNEIVECVNQNCCFHHSSKCQIDTTQSVSINNTSNSNLIRDNSICCCVLTTTGQKDKVHCKTECKVTTCRTLSGKSFPASIADAISSRTGDSCDDVTDCNVDRVSEDDNSSADSDDHLRSNSCISTEDTNQSSQCLPASSKSAAVTVPPRQRASSFRLAEVSTQVPRSENRKLINRKVFSMNSGIRVALTALLFFLALGLDNRILGANATERPRYRTTYACEGSTLNMECEAGHVINLIRANYGRFSITICNEHGNTEWSVNCMSRRSHRVLHDKCSQRQNCSVAASTRGFGDPCPGTLKYLEAQFQCVPGGYHRDQLNIPLGRPRPIWLVDAQSTVSSITGDQPLKRPANSRDPSRGDDGSPSGIDGPGGPADPDGVGVLGTLPDGDDLDDPIDPDLLSDSDDSDTPSSSTTSTTTTTLRPPPWLKTNVTKNTTTTTTTTTTTSTTTTTTLPPPSSTDAERASSQTISSPRPPGHSYNSGAGGGGGGSSLADLPDGGEGGVGLDEDRILEQEETAEREVLFEEQDRLLNKELGHSFSQSYPGTPSGPGGGPLSEGEAAGWPPREAWCGPSSGRGLLWNWTQAGDMAIQACPGGASGWARRACLVEGWASRADLGECRSVWLSTLTARGLGKDSVLAVVHDLSAVTAVRALYGGDVTAAARLLSSLAKRMAISLSHFPDTAQREALLTELLSATLSSASHLIGSQEEAWGDLRPPDHRAAATALLLGLEQAAFLLADNLWQQKVVGQSLPNILMRLQVLETRNLAAITFPSQDEAWQNPTPMPIPPSPSPLEPAASSIILHQTSSSSPYLTTPSPAQSAYDSITLPPEALLENSENGLVKMVFFSYRGLEKLLQPDAVIQAGDQLAYKRANRTRLLNSRILAASLGSGRHIELSQPVIITFALLTTTNVTNASCVFWDYTTSLWSEEGCRVVGTNVTHVSCQCEHLTNFAVLMDFHATPLPPNHSLALAVITYVGCVVSIVCLILAILVFHVFRGLKSDRTSIHKNLCGCLLVAEVVFLGGVHQTGNAVVCGVVAGLLHYFFLAAFAWMFMEGLQLYLLLVEVFEAERSRLKVYCGICYGGPALIVLISAVVDPFGYGTERACWLSTENYFIFAFVGPVAAVLLANTVFLVLSLVVLCRHASASASLKNKEHTKLASVRTWLRGAFVLMFLLGLTWTFGLLYLNQQTLVMAYIFTVLNSLQGLFIFIFHCVQNDKVKKEMRGACRRHPWLRACLCDSRALHTPTTSCASKPDTRGPGSLRRHPSLTPSAGPNAVGTNSANTAINNGLPPTHLHSNDIHHHQYNTSTSGSHQSCGATNADTPNTTTPLHRAHMANVVAAHHITNNIDHHHHPIPKHSHTPNSSYSDQILVERPNNFSVPTSPSLSSSPTSSSASELNASFSVSHQESGHHPSYQNYLAFRAQQLNAAQIYASPPGTPLSQLYDTAGPSAVGAPCTLPSGAPPISTDPRHTPHSAYTSCEPPASPHLYLQPQAYPRPSVYQQAMHEPPTTANSLALKAALSSLSPGNVPRTISTTALHNYHNAPHRFPNSHSMPGSPEDENYLQPSSYAHQPEARSSIRGLHTMPHAHPPPVGADTAVIYQGQQPPMQQTMSYLQYNNHHPNQMSQKCPKPSKGNNILRSNLSTNNHQLQESYRRAAAS